MKYEINNVNHTVVWILSMLAQLQWLSWCSNIYVEATTSVCYSGWLYILLGLKSVSEQKETFNLYYQSFLCIHKCFTVAERGIWTAAVTLLYCRISSCCSGTTLAVSQSCKQAEHLTASVCLVSSSSHCLFLSARLNLSCSNWVMSDRRRHKRGPSSSCRYTVPLENMTTDITSTQGQIGGMTDTKRTMRETRSADVCGELSDKLPIMRHCLSTNAESFGLNQPFTCR